MRRGRGVTEKRGCSEKQKQNSVVAPFNTRALRLKGKRIIY